MTTSPNHSPAPSERPEAVHRVPLRLALGTADRSGGVDGVWWPQSRDLQSEAADLVDNYPGGERIHRLLFSRPDWDDAEVSAGRGTRRIQAGRGPVKVGSFPSDDTHLMVLTMAAGRRVSLRVIPSSTSPDEAERAMQAAGS